MDNINEISIIGLGYVGLPLAVEFSKYYKTIGYDINSTRIKELNNHVDITLEISRKELKNVITKKNKNSTGLFLSNNLDSIKKVLFGNSLTNFLKYFSE